MIGMTTAVRAALIVPIVLLAALHARSATVRATSPSTRRESGDLCATITFGASRRPTLACRAAVAEAAAVAHDVVGRRAGAANDLSSSYSWKPVRIGAGGWADGILVSDSDPEVRFVRDDTGQAYRWDRARREWMPMCVQNDDGSGFGTSIIREPAHALAADPRSFALDPRDNRVLFLFASFGDQSTAGSLPMNVYKSLDGGRSFVATDLAKAAGFTLESGDTDAVNFRYMGDRLAVDPNNSRVVYLGTGSRGLFRSTDGGMRWAAANGGGLPAGVDFMNVLPYAAGGKIDVDGALRSRVVYLVAARGDVYRSRDGGANWTDITPGGAGPAGKCFQATLSQGDGALYVPTSDKSLWKLDGAGWKRVRDHGCVSLAVDPRSPNRLFAVGDATDVSRSLDGGATWTDLKLAPAGALGSAGAPHPTMRSSSKIVMDRNGDLWVVEGNDGLIRWHDDTTRDRFRWTPDCKGIENFCAMDIVIPKGGAGRAICTVEDNNGMVLDGLDTFAVHMIEPQTGWGLSNGGTVAVCPNDPNTFAMVSGTNYGPGAGSWTTLTTDGGKTFRVFRYETNVPRVLLDTRWGNFAISRRGNWPAGSDHMVWLPRARRTPPYYSRDGGRTWAPARTDFGDIVSDTTQGFGMDKELVADPFTPDKYYVNFTRGGFWVSSDGGETWTQRASPGNSDYHRGLAANFAVHDNLWWGGKFTNDGGFTWQTAMNLPSETGVVALGKGRGRPGDAPYTVYLSASSYDLGHQAADYGVFRSTDGGRTWDRIAHWPYGLFVSAGMIAASWDTFGLVALGADGQGFVYGQPKELSSDR